MQWALPLLGAKLEVSGRGLLVTGIGEQPALGGGATVKLALSLAAQAARSSGRGGLRKKSHSQERTAALWCPPLCSQLNSLLPPTGLTA